MKRYLLLLLLLVLLTGCLNKVDSTKVVAKVGSKVYFVDDVNKRISNLDPQGITFYLDELEKKIEELLSSSMPEKFNSPPIISRIKLIQMQVMKCRFYSENQQNNKLEPALSEMYKYYNSLLKRMISLVEEESVLPGVDKNQ